MTICILDVSKWAPSELYAKWFSETAAPQFICVLSPKAKRALGEIGGEAIPFDGDAFASFVARELVVCVNGKADDKWVSFAFDELSNDPDDEDSLDWKIEGAGLEVVRQLPKLDWRDFESTAGHPSMWTVEDAWGFWKGEHGGPSRYPWPSIQWSPLRDDLSKIVATGAQYADQPVARIECLKDIALCLDKPMLPGPYLLELEELRKQGDVDLSESQSAALSASLNALFQ